jgi:pilus assembly protein Flp/PilA
MSNFLFRLMALRHDRRGVTALEYGLIAASVVAIGLAGFSIIGQDVADKFNSVEAALT